MEILMKLQQTTTGNLSGLQPRHRFSAAGMAAGAIPEEWRYTSQPSIAYCWYWGCSDKCQSHRYFVNHLWLVVFGCIDVGSFVEFYFDVARAPFAKEVVERGGREWRYPNWRVVTRNQSCPTVGRRRRMQNPSGLLF